MFEKASLRTRLSFYLAIRQLGGGTITLRSNELHLGKGGESIADTAKFCQLMEMVLCLELTVIKKLMNL